MKKSLVFKLFTPVMAFAVLAGCNNNKEEISEDVTYKGFRLQLKESELNQAQIDIAAKVNNDQPIAFKDITAALVNQHGEMYFQRNKNRGDTALVKADFMSQSMLDIMNGNISEKRINIDADFNTIKVENEAFLKQAFSDVALLYNKDANSPMDVIVINKLQCYSGTVYHTMQFRSGLRKQYVNKNPVIIYTSGHILPGYIANNTLIGVETTAEGRAEMNYGAVDKLNMPIRIVDAEFFALSEIFKTKLINQQDFMDQALKQTAEKYKIPLDRLEAHIATVSSFGKATPGSGEVAVQSLVLNSDMMAFGKAQVASGDQQRTVVEKRTIEQAPVDAIYVEGVVFQKGDFADQILMRDMHFQKDEQGRETLLLLSHGPTRELLDMNRLAKAYDPNRAEDQARAESLLSKFHIQELKCRVSDPLEVGYQEAISQAGYNKEIKAALIWNMERQLSFDCGPQGQFQVEVRGVTVRSYNEMSEEWLSGFNEIYDGFSNINYIENITIQAGGYGTVLGAGDIDCYDGNEQSNMITNCPDPVRYQTN